MEATVSGLAGRSRRRRRFLILGLAGLAVLAAALGVSFTADTGTTSVTVTAGTTSGLVFPIANSAALPSGVDFQTLKGGTTVTAGSPNTVNVAAGPSWTPVANTAGAVTEDGDLFVVDGRSASAGGASSVVVTLYITNLAALQTSYSSYAWPIKVYQADSSAGTVNTAAWAKVTSPFNTDSFFMTHTSGFLTYTLTTAANRFYLITMDTGGSFYTVSTAGGSSSLSPSFYLTAQAT